MCCNDITKKAWVHDALLYAIGHSLRVHDGCDESSEVSQSAVQTRCNDDNVSPSMKYSRAIVIYALLIASVGRCLTTPASSKVDAAPQDEQGSGLALIYG